MEQFDSSEEASSRVLEQGQGLYSISAAGVKSFPTQ